MVILADSPGLVKVRQVASNRLAATTGTIAITDRDLSSGVAVALLIRFDPNQVGTRQNIRLPGYPYVPPSYRVWHFLAPVERDVLLVPGWGILGLNSVKRKGRCPLQSRQRTWSFGNLEANSDAAITVLCANSG